MRNGRSRSFKVINFDNSRKQACDFLLVNSSNVDPIVHRFRDIAGIFAKLQSPHRHVGEIFEDVPKE